MGVREEYNCLGRLLGTIVGDNGMILNGKLERLMTSLQR